MWARNSAIRAEQVRRLTADAEARVHPVILAGDSNLPSDSALFRHYLARFEDGFAHHGVGLGYTFPAHRRFRWLRIDRVLAGRGAKILDFAVGDRTGSDHRPVHRRRRDYRALTALRMASSSASALPGNRPYSISGW